ncbi:MAG: ArsR family transcriptional regulator [Acidobacteria bacterium RIFCSPLOWO2_02_FULL_59_13]|nr:MAG: ArsR family transcriptional regulator [Acidobacteria bacterium RIFCSPLOWO2_02_FULL_59_13]OGA71886.1 MAG: ArsR family transcriptional regulator [Betaproteobacteria bacterium RIFCSPLOWO2_12_FULL_65_14]
MPKAMLDATDRRILDELQSDGRLSNQELAERVSLSPSPCLRRVRALERAGIIRRYAAVLDPLQVGLGLLAYVTVKLEKRGKMPVDQFTRAVESWPEVIACYSMTGDMDYLMRVQVENLEHYSRFVMDKLLKQPGVIDIRTNFVLERVKETSALPLGHLA